MTQIVTGDAVVLDLRPARVPTRMLATAIDLIIMYGSVALWFWLVGKTDFETSQKDLLGLIGYFVLMLSYPIIMETLTRGRTVGAYAVGLRVVRDDGGTIGFRQALIRGLAFTFVDVSPFTAFLGALICSTVNRDGKRIGDLLAGTLVIRIRAPKVTGELPDGDPELLGWAQTLQLSRVTDEQVAAARYALQRGRLMRPTYRRALMFSLASQVARVISPPPPPGVDPERFLATVLAEQRRRNATKHVVSLGVDIPAGWR